VPLQRLGSEIVDLCDDRETMKKRPRSESDGKGDSSMENGPVLRQPLASLQGSSGNWVSWRNAEGHLVMAERQQPSSQGEHGPVGCFYLDTLSSCGVILLGCWVICGVQIICTVIYHKVALWQVLRKRAMMSCAQSPQ